jgi:hypothetical protein
LCLWLGGVFLSFSTCSRASSFQFLLTSYARLMEYQLFSNNVYVVPSSFFYLCSFTLNCVLVLVSGVFLWCCFWWCCICAGCPLVFFFLFGSLCGVGGLVLVFILLCIFLPLWLLMRCFRFVFLLAVLLLLLLSVVRGFGRLPDCLLPCRFRCLPVLLVLVGC